MAIPVTQCREYRDLDCQAGSATVTRAVPGLAGGPAAAAKPRRLSRARDITIPLAAAGHPGRVSDGPRTLPAPGRAALRFLAWQPLARCGPARKDSESSARAGDPSRITG